MSKKIIIYIIKSLFQHGFCWLKILFFFFLSLKLDNAELGQCQPSYSKHSQYFGIYYVGFHIL